MTDEPQRPLAWATAAAGQRPAGARVAMYSLDEHVDACTRDGRPLVALLCMAERVNSFLAPRFVTTVTLATALVGAVALLS